MIVGKARVALETFQTGKSSRSFFLPFVFLHSARRRRIYRASFLSSLAIMRFYVIAREEILGIAFQPTRLAHTSIKLSLAEERITRFSNDIRMRHFSVKLFL